MEIDPTVWFIDIQVYGKGVAWTVMGSRWFPEAIQLQSIVGFLLRTMGRLKAKLAEASWQQDVILIASPCFGEQCDVQHTVNMQNKSRYSGEETNGGNPNHNHIYTSMSNGTPFPSSIHRNPSSTNVWLISHLACRSATNHHIIGSLRNLYHSNQRWRARYCEQSNWLLHYETKGPTLVSGVKRTIY